jgi:hypothetical protein
MKPNLWLRAGILLVPGVLYLLVTSAHLKHIAGLIIAAICAPIGVILLADLRRELNSGFSESPDSYPPARRDKEPLLYLTNVTFGLIGAVALLIISAAGLYFFIRGLSG